MAAVQDYSVEDLKRIAGLSKGPDINALVQSNAAKYGVDPDLIHAVIQQESGGNQNAVSNKGALGTMQLMPDTAKAMGVDPSTVEGNIEGGTKYLSQMLKKFNGDTNLALAAYNAGPGAVQKYKGIPPFAETQDYVKKISGNYETAKKNSNSREYSIDELKQIAGQATAQAATVPQKKASEMSTGEGALRGYADAVPQAAGLSGILRTIPQFRALADVVGGQGLGTAAQEFTKGYAGFDPSQYEKGASKYASKKEEAKATSPIAFGVSKAVGEVPQYMVGGELLKAAPILTGEGAIPAIARSALVNTGVAQAHDVNPEAIPLELALGAGFEGLGQLVGGAVKGVANKVATKRLGSPEAAKQALSYGFSKDAASLFGKNKNFLDDTYSQMGEIASRNPNIGVSVPENITPGDIKKLAIDRLMSTQTAPAFSDAQALEDVANTLAQTGKISPNQALHYRKMLGQEAFSPSTGVPLTSDAAQAVRNTRSALNENLFSALPEGEGSALKDLGTEYGKGSALRRSYKPTPTGAKPSLKKDVSVSPLEATAYVLSGGLGAIPGLGMKAIQTVPGFTGLNSLGDIIKQVLPLSLLSGQNLVKP